MILVPQETVASSDQELELDITAGNIAFEERKTPSWRKKEKEKEKQRYDILMSRFVCLLTNRSYIFISLVL